MSAIISECGKYRYVLKREIPQVIRWVKPCLFIMLNPSTADAERDDPTIRRCVSFAKREGCTSLTVVNLFARRSTYPEFLDSDPDPVGPENDRYIDEELKAHSFGIKIAAWGARPIARDRGDLLALLGGRLHCLGVTKSGAPKHPLYLKNDAPLMEYI